MMSCDICKPKLEAESGTSKKISQKRDMRFQDFATDRWKCQQLWLSKHGEKNCTSATVQKHVEITNYLNILQDVVLEYESLVAQSN